MLPIDPTKKKTCTRHICDGDLVIVYEMHDNMKAVKPGVINNHFKRSINNDRDCIIIIEQKPCVWSLFFRNYNENCLPEAMEIYPTLQGCHRKRLTTIVDYCNGLVCLRYCDEEIALWNPLIRKYKKLSSEPVKKRCTLITRSKDSDAPLHNILALDFAKENFRVY
uniref:Uncharacterized protein n=1 Tax=Quercus lobata TaxID=97700 RepID=A0A7N2LU16_QUELO